MGGATDTRTISVRDDFDCDCNAKAVVGNLATDGTLRRGRDVEGLLSVDGGALRLAAPRKPGFGRHSLAYGPFDPVAGLTLAVYALNGHNASQTVPLDREHPRRDVTRRLWWRLKGDTRDVLARIVGRVAAESRWAARRSPQHRHWPPVRESLTVGWFSDEAVDGQLDLGPRFVMRSADHECGTLTVAIEGELRPLLRGVQNVPLCLVIQLRPDGAEYFLSSIPGVPGTEALPALRPVAIDSRSIRDPRYVGIGQGILGEIGFCVDTRVQAVRAAVVPAWSSWYGSACLADRFDGEGDVASRAPAVGSGLATVQGKMQRSARGLSADGVACAFPEVPTGLLAVQVEPGLSSEGGLVLRASSESDFLAVLAGSEGIRLVHHHDQGEVTLHRDPALRTTGCHLLQVLDDGSRLSVGLDHRDAFGGPVSVLLDGAGVGVIGCGAVPARLFDFEAHPRAIEMPVPLRADPSWWTPPESGFEIEDAFEGERGDLADGLEGAPWVRTLGHGVIERSGAATARVRASVEFPNPGRTLYTLPWRDAHFADLEVTIEPPGMHRGEHQSTRGGLVIWQDADSYLVINEWNDDFSPGFAVTSFLVVRGQEDLYRAVWSNLGDRVQYGVPHCLRVCCDGSRFVVYIDAEPVLYRSTQDIVPDAQPLQIRHVGLAVNWEFGDDTGTVFRRFRARQRHE